MRVLSLGMLAHRIACGAAGHEPQAGILDRL
jgi:hypothetical protein